MAKSLWRKAATDPIAGVTDAMGGKAGGLVDLHLAEIADVRSGGIISPAISA